VSPPTDAWLVLVDFDGTITARDADFVIADAARGAAAARAVYEPLALAYEGLEISLTQYFEGYLAGLGLSAAEIARHVGAVPCRPGFLALVATCEARGWALRVVSEGLDAYIRPMLESMGAGELELSCNRLLEGPDGPRVLSPLDGESCERCSNCKGAHVRRAHAAGQRVVMVGNGASDLCAARLADLVFARDTLATLCDAEALPYLSWDGFPDVLAGLPRPRPFRSPRG
jgi:2-hydroxy-3-keto-5-methylthiopentenyl-1-phosphate phosphatase